MEKTFYDSTSFEYGYSSKEEILSNMNPNLKEVIENYEGKIITDVGCGCGRNLVFSTKFANKLIGVDLSKQSLEFAKNVIQYKTKVGNFIMENTFVLLHFLMYKIFRKQKLTLQETRNIFYDYFITPIATFQSKKDVELWINDSSCTLEKYDRTNGNFHVFIIKKGE